MNSLALELELCESFVFLQRSKASRAALCIFSSPLYEIISTVLICNAWAFWSYRKYALISLILHFHRFQLNQQSAEFSEFPPFSVDACRVAKDSRNFLRLIISFQLGEPSRVQSRFGKKCSRKHEGNPKTCYSNTCAVHLLINVRKFCWADKANDKFCCIAYVAVNVVI